MNKNAYTFHPFTAFTHHFYIADHIIINHHFSVFLRNPVSMCGTILKLHLFKNVKLSKSLSFIDSLDCYENMHAIGARAKVLKCEIITAQNEI